MLTTGNLDGNDRVALFLMDYPNREEVEARIAGLEAKLRDHPAT